MENEELLTEVQKSQEGATLGLQAVHDVLQKQNGILDSMKGYFDRIVQKQDDDDEKLAARVEEEEEVKSFDRLVKALKSAGFETKSEEPVAVIEKEDSTEKKHPISSKPAGQQEVIQASEDGKEIAKGDEKTEEIAVAEVAEVAKQDDEEEEEEEEKEYPEMEKMQKAIDDLKKENTELKKGVETTIEDTLRKMGFRKERKATSPQKTELGSDEDAIVKAVQTDGVDRIEELAKLSWTELRQMQTLDESGNLPDEFKKYIQ